MKVYYERFFLFHFFSPSCSSSTSCSFSRPPTAQCLYNYYSIRSLQYSMYLRHAALYIPQVSISYVYNHICIQSGCIDRIYIYICPWVGTSTWGTYQCCRVPTVVRIQEVLFFSYITGYLILTSMPRLSCLFDKRCTVYLVVCFIY